MDPFQHFVDAQSMVWANVQEELSQGHKTSHWMWFVFPQLSGLGSSLLARQYGIDDLAMAKAYQEHEILGPRLIEATKMVCKHQGKSLDAIFGNPDKLKFISCMTLFAKASGNKLFKKAIKAFDVKKDKLTLARI
ncbi:DUF1810 domain-containing protein [Thalassotalea euphylliae]|uniref:DUF1810 domain-containing protein n=1 Tax=Thalassotalea euphylliae TaxID=1655234 RepID=UPI00362785D0